MTSNPSAKKLLRARATEKASHVEAIRILHGVHKDPGPSSDRALVIQGVAMIEHALECCIRKHLQKNLDEKVLLKIFGHREAGLLSNFGSRVLLAHALGEFGSKTLEDLNTIGEIRNAFAHAHLPIDFNFQPVVTLCDSLGLWRRGFQENWPTTTRDRFIWSVAAISSSLTVFVKVVGPIKGVTIKWQPLP